jgi:hypothetical protein
VLKLVKGGDVIQWRPESAGDKGYSVVVVTVAANHLKARDIKEIQDQAGGGKGADFTESIAWDGVPGPLQDIAHNPGNKLSAKRHGRLCPRRRGLEAASDQLKQGKNLAGGGNLIDPARVS